MKAVDPGILPQSACFSFTPPDMAKRMLFYPIWCGHYYCTANYFIRRDAYPAMLAVFVRRGVFRVEYRGERRRAFPGDVLLLDCTEPHYYHAEDGLEFLYIHYDGSNARELTRHILDTEGWLIRAGSNRNVEALLLEMVELYERGETETPFESSLRIYRLLCLLMTGSAKEQERGPIDEAVQYIRANVGRAMTVEELAGVAKLSPFYFSHRFRSKTGFAPMEYVINTRMDRAKILLANTTKSVEEIAWEVGYASSGSFINLFVKRIGISPARFRKNFQNVR